MATKTSILVFYLRLAKNTQKILRLASWAVLGVVNVAGTILTFMNIFQCDPINAAWDISVKPVKCIPLLTEFICSAPVNVTTDLAILALPIPVLTSMRLPLKQKTIMVLTFALGIFVTIVDVVRIYYLQQAIEYVPMSSTSDAMAMFGQSAGFSWNASFSLMWSAVEVNVGIICACVPTLKPLMIRILPAIIIDPDGTRRSSTLSSQYTSGRPKPNAADDSQSPAHVLSAGLTQMLADPPALRLTPPEDRLSEEISIRDFLSGAPQPRASIAHSSGQNPSILLPQQRDSTSVYFGFVNVKRPKSMLKTTAPESFQYCTIVSILFFIWGFSYGLLNTLNNVVADVANMTTAQTLGLTSIYFGGGYFFGPLLVGEWLLRHDEHHRCKTRGRGRPESVGGFKVTFIAGLLIYGTGTIMFWPSAVLAAYGGFMVSSFVVGFGLAVLETAANPFIALCGPPEYADARLLLAQGVQAASSVLSGLLANNVFFARNLAARRGEAATLIDVQWTYLAVTLLSVLLALLFYYMPLPELSDDELAELASHLPVDLRQKALGGRITLRTWAIALAVLAQWTYVAAQENTSLFFHDLIASFLPPSASAASSSSSEGLTISIPSYLLIAHTAFCASRFLAALLCYLSSSSRSSSQKPQPSSRPTQALLNSLLPTSRGILAISIALSTLAALTTVLLSPRNNNTGINPNLPAIPIILFFFFEGPIWPLIFSLGLRGQGARTKRAAAWLTMGGSAPGVWPFVAWGITLARQRQQQQDGVRLSFVLVVLLMAVAGVYPLFLGLVRGARELVDFQHTVEVHTSPIPSARSRSDDQGAAGAGERDVEMGADRAISHSDGYNGDDGSGRTGEKPEVIGGGPNAQGQGLGQGNVLDTSILQS
jgi:fucose permease